MTPTLVLTRPEAQSREIAAALGEGTRVVISPVMRIVAADTYPEIGGYEGVVLTSANGLVNAPDLRGKPTWCVGNRTAAAAEAAGANVRLVARDANDLVARFEGAGPVIHLRGQYARGDIAKRLNSAGIETDEAVVYRQEALRPTPEALAAVEGSDPVVLPLFSPRSAKLFGERIGKIGAAVEVIAMSDAVAEAWREATGGAAQVVPAPNGNAMLSAIKSALFGDAA